MFGRKSQVRHSAKFSTKLVYKKISLTSLTYNVLIDFSLTVKAATLIFISGCGLAISSAKDGKSGLIFNLFIIW